MSAPAEPTAADRKRWAQYLVDERAEASVYRYLAERKSGMEREVLLKLADAEGRHEQHWIGLLGGVPDRLPHRSFRNWVLVWMARRFGAIFVLALAQNAEARSPYDDDPYATPQMRADEKIHHEVVRGLAADSRREMSGSFRAAVFGANDGLVSNFALVLGVGASGVSSTFILLSGIAGLLAGAMSMGAGEFVSVRSQREMLESTEANDYANDSLPDLDLDANELALVFRARGESEESSLMHARSLITDAKRGRVPEQARASDTSDVVGSAWKAAAASFCFFASGAIIPVLPWIVGFSGAAAVIVAVALVSVALLVVGAFVGLLSGGPPLRRALRQLAIGLGAAAVTYMLGLLFGVSTS
ncbi:MAG: VIT1/CCC1 family protein [Microbacterium sp.]